MLRDETSRREALNILENEDPAIYAQVLTRYTPKQRAYIEAFRQGVETPALTGDDALHTSVGYQQHCEVLETEQTGFEGSPQAGGNTAFDWKTQYPLADLPIFNDNEGKKKVLVWHVCPANMG